MATQRLTSSPVKTLLFRKNHHQNRALSSGIAASAKKQEWLSVPIASASKAVTCNGDVSSSQRLAASGEQKRWKSSDATTPTIIHTNPDAEGKI